VRSGCRTALAIHAEGLVDNGVGAERFTTLTVRTTIQGADTAQRQAEPDELAVAGRRSILSIAL